VTGAAVTKGTWPNLFVVGAARAGTTSLWRYLDRHPEIWMAPIKEPHFFSGVKPRLYLSIDDEAAYLRLFAPGAHARLRGEASPSYLWHESAAGSIKRVSPGARIVIMLRDPVDRTYSAYWHAVRHGIEARSFLEAVEAELEEPVPGGTPSRYVGRSFYANSVRRYLDLFPGAVHLVFFEEFTADVHGEVAKVFAFLGVDSSVALRLDGAAHEPFALPRNQAAAIVHNSPRLRAAARLAVPPGLYPLVQRALLKRPPKPEMEAQALELLTAHFAPDVERLRLLLARELPWARYRRAEPALEPAR
jgi:hypothetical protein